MPQPDAFEPPFTLAERIKFTLVPAPFYARYLVNKNLRKGEPELRVLPDIVPPGRVAVDVGANKSVYTHVLAGLASHVHAFEPDPKAFRWLNRALPGNATAHALALSDHDGDAELYVPRRGRGYSNQLGSMNAEKSKTPHGTVRIKARTLDSCAFTNIGFIKIDVEGHEAEVLAGATRSISQFRPVLLIELEERHTGRPIEQTIGAVTSHGYNAHFVQGGKLTPIEAFDPDAQHRSPATRGSYIYNFIFLPR